MDERTAPIVKKIFELSKEGMLPIKVAEILTNDKVPVPSEMVGNVHTRTANEIKRGWTRSSIVRILKNETYLGVVRNGMYKKISYKSNKILINEKKDWITKENMHEPLVDKETFDIVQSLIESRTRARTNKYDWLLKGIVECEECGKKLSICVHKHKRDNGTTAYLRCNTYASNTNKGFCTPHSNSLNVVTDLVIEMVRERCKSFLQEEDYNKSAIQLQRRINTRKNMIKNEIASLNKQLADVNKKIDKIYEDKISETLREEDFKRLYLNFSERRTAIEKMIVELEKTSEEEEKIIDITKIVKQFMKMKDVSRPMLVSLVDKVVINEQKEITIYYKFKILNLQALKTNEEFVNEKIG